MTYRGLTSLYIAHDGQNSGAVKALVDHRSLPRVVLAVPQRDPLLSLLVDFWIAVEAEAFVGNQASTISVIVCAVRVARGKGCEGWAYGVHPDDVKGPRCIAPV